MVYKEKKGWGITSGKRKMITQKKSFLEGIERWGKDGGTID